MLVIRTVIEKSAYHFDQAVNNNLSEGWELVRRECFITGSDRATTFYAELEKVIEADEEEEEDDAPAQWLITRNPAKPLRCSNCGYEETSPKRICPNCIKIMEDC